MNAEQRERLQQIAEAWMESHCDDPSHDHNAPAVGGVLGVREGESDE